MRFPDLRLAFSEGQISWLPYLLERADTVWQEHRAWTGTRGMIPTANTVSTHIRNIYAKLGADARSAAVRQARQLGLLSVT